MLGVGWCWLLGAEGALGFGGRPRGRRRGSGRRRRPVLGAAGAVPLVAVEVPGGDGSGAASSRAAFAATAASAAFAASVFVGLPEVATAAASVPATSSPVIAITSRSPRELVGKSGRRVPIPRDRPKAHTTSTPPTM